MQECMHALYIHFTLLHAYAFVAEMVMLWYYAATNSNKQMSSCTPEAACDNGVLWAGVLGHW